MVDVEGIGPPAGDEPLEITMNAYCIRLIVGRLRWSAWFCAAGCALMLIVGCDGSKDVTNDSSYGDFSNVMGTWRTKAPLYLKERNTSSNRDRKLIYIDTALQGNSAAILATLPPGTEIRVEHRIHEWTAERDLFYATGSLVSGRYAGQTVELSEKLFQPADRVGALRRDWKVAPGMLVKSE